MKKVATMQDISCVGKCSLTVALPILSSMSIETAVLPTAVLSTHTAFKGFTFCDLTNEIQPILEHWKKENFKFNALYTGYLGSIKQIELAKEFFHLFGENIPKIVDPCMGDHGKLYTGFDIDFVEEMKKLCSFADIICPNITEACYLLDIPVLTSYTEEDIKEISKKLTELGCKKAVITGISFDEKEYGIYAYNKENDNYAYYFLDKLPVAYHGTGDIWASTLTGAIALGRRFENAIEIATDFTHECMEETLKDTEHDSYGVEFEKALPYLETRLTYR